MLFWASVLSSHTDMKGSLAEGQRRLDLAPSKDLMLAFTQTVAQV